jgi:glycosyltransferase involved in cell wall biosynthesis
MAGRSIYGGLVMKIFFIRHSLLSRGGDKMIVAHANHLANSGHQVCIKSNRLSTVFPINSRITIALPAFRGKLGTILSALLEKQDTDLVVADIIPLACLLYFRNRNKVVYFAQDYDESYYTNFLQRLFIRLLYFIGLYLFRIPTIAVSEQLADLLEKRFGANAEVARNGIDTKIFFPEPSAELISGKENRKAILILSRSDARKGFDIAQGVVYRLKGRSEVPLEIWTVGEKAEGRFPGLLHRDFGYVNEEVLRHIMSSADLFFYPTRHEGLPLMPLEALACGCPVLTTTAVPYGNSGSSIFVTEIEDREAMLKNLEAFMDNDYPFCDFKRQERRLVEQYDIEACKRQFENSLVNIAGESSCV